MTKNLDHDIGRQDTLPPYITCPNQLTTNKMFFL